MSDNHSIAFDADVWLYQGPTSWYFATVPKTQSEQVRFLATDLRSGWGSVRVEVCIGNSVWKTSLFPSKESGCYLLPLKADIRKKENIAVGGTIHVTLKIG